MKVIGGVFMGMFFKNRIGIDLGSTNTVIYIENKGIALREPTLVAFSKSNQQVVAFGKEAQQLVGRTSDTYEISSPIKEGVIADFELTKKLLAYFISKAMHRQSAKPEVVLCVPSNITKVERRGIIDAIKSVGVRKALIVEKPYAAALGARLPIKQPKGYLMVDIGGGTTDIAVISFDEIVLSKTIVFGSQKMDEAIIDAVREKYHLIISRQDAQYIKETIGKAYYIQADKNDSVKIKGRQLGTGVPSEVTVDVKIVIAAVEPIIEQIIVGIMNVLEQTPPELSVDILEQGMFLTGGGALLVRLPELLQDRLGIVVHLVDTPLDTVALGAGKLFESLEYEMRKEERNRR